MANNKRMAIEQRYLRIILQLKSIMGEGKVLGAVQAPIKKKWGDPTKTPLIDKDVLFKNRALKKHDNKLLLNN